MVTAVMRAAHLVALPGRAEERIRTHWLVDPNTLTMLIERNSESNVATTASLRYAARIKRERHSAFVAETRDQLAEAISGLQGDHPEGQHRLSGDCYVAVESDRKNLYGGGQWWVIEDVAIWSVCNNGRDGDDWSRNNVQTGGAGAIGIRYPRDSALENVLKTRCLRLPR